ncbi:hypothetical protein E4P82_18400 [Candidatus Competibacter phosphatis]|uniref:Uncharacterized protein n=1 Tax=Candidatus Competibacter phosphatis TaxID=221280 RepID=A0ABX1TSR2_9GAMM|nr:hypothetical protein [Candidatus Competibacter phosphatis]NMQ20985.1 hypothetical protein [Candidatus Competibacter phosphatis]
MSRRRKTLTANQKRDALMQCDHISRALRSLAMETLNRHAKISDTDHALRLAASVERLKGRIWKYPAERRKAEAEANRKRAEASRAQIAEQPRTDTGKVISRVSPQVEAGPGKNNKPQPVRDHAHIDVIGEIMDSAANMPSSLRNDPAGLLHLGAQALCDPNASRNDLHQALFAALAFVGARHHQRIENQLREATKAMRGKMN